VIWKVSSTKDYFGVMLVKRDSWKKVTDMWTLVVGSQRGFGINQQQYEECTL
jgi:hypothetical protein